jgi:branched-chain amino acid transport system ATP-binding protein
MITKPLLEVSELSVSYNGFVKALDSVSLQVFPGELITLVGSNGAGKTTLLRAISGIVKPQSGTIMFRNVDLKKLPPEKIVRQGIAHSPEGRQVLGQQSVEDNLLLGAYVRKDKAVQSDLEKMYSFFPRLKERRKQRAGTLSGGEQQMLAMSRALMSRPELLLLDEPSLGLAPLIVREIFRFIEQLRREGVTILLVEQNARLALEAADRAYVLDSGRILLAGSASDLLLSDAVRDAYLG